MGKAKNSTSTKSKPLNGLKTIFGAVDYVHEISLKSNLVMIGSGGELLGEYVKHTIFVTYFFSRTRLWVRPSSRF